MRGCHLERQFLSSNQAETQGLARALSAGLGMGDALLLDGPVGAGKSVIAREIIRHRLEEYGAIEDIPSPSYTLVQCYTAGALDIWHTDLYRLSSTDELYELGLDEAFETALVLVEWAGRLSALKPARHLQVTLEIDADPEARRINIQGVGGGWAWLNTLTI